MGISSEDGWYGTTDPSPPFAITLYARFPRASATGFGMTTRHAGCEIGRNEYFRG